MNTVDLLQTGRVWRASEVLTRPSPVPADPGVYGWRFDRSPDPRLPAGRILYVGLAPRRMATRASRQNLRTRIRYHFRGNAEGSTLRLTLGCLLGLELRRVGSGNRLTFGQASERQLTAWMADNAQVCWLPHPQPWIAESELITQLDLPLNLDQNRNHAFHQHLSDLRASARARARALPIAT